VPHLVQSIAPLSDADSPWCLAAAILWTMPHCIRTAQTAIATLRTKKPQSATYNSHRPEGRLPSSRCIRSALARSLELRNRAYGRSRYSTRTSRYLSRTAQLAYILVWLSEGRFLPAIFNAGQLSSLPAVAFPATSNGCCLRYASHSLFQRSDLILRRDFESGQGQDQGKQLTWGSAAGLVNPHLLQVMIGVWIFRAARIR
jgi:hypothetical protein